MRILPSIPKVLHLEFPTRKEMTLSMCRMSEFFEGPHQNIKDQVFDFEKFLDAYTNDSGKIDYFSEWEGFNIPKLALNRFDLLFADLTDRENKVIEAFLDGDFEYLIATDKDTTKETIAHELCHAQYAMDDRYKKQIDDMLSAMSADLYTRLKIDLMKAGYPDDPLIIQDEIHAYLKTSDEAELLETFPSVTKEERQPFSDLLRTTGDV